MVLDMNIMIEYLSVLGYMATAKKYEDAVNLLIGIYVDLTEREHYIDYMKLRIIPCFNPSIPNLCHRCNEDTIVDGVIPLCCHKYCLDCFLNMLDEEIYYCYECHEFIA